MQWKEPRFRFADKEYPRIPRISEFELVARKSPRRLDYLSVTAMAVAGFSGSLIVMAFSPELASMAARAQYRVEQVESAISEPLRRPFRRIARALD